MIKPLLPSDFDKIFAIMEQSFPIDEYRPYEAQKALFSDPAYRVYGETDNNGRILSFIALWELENCLFVEHLASAKEYRNMGLGSKLLRFAQESSDKLVCLEVEPPETPLSIRRIGFYQRNGFHLNPYPYAQPSLSPGQSPVPLFIMTSGRGIRETEFTGIRDTLYRRVYHACP